MTSSKFLLCPKVLGSGNRWQLNDYQKYLLNNSQNLQKRDFFVFVVYVSCRYMKYLIFEVSRVCTNCCFKLYRLAAFKNGLVKKLIRYFQYFHYSNIGMACMTNLMKKLPFFRQILELLTRFYHIASCINNRPIKILEKWKYPKWQSSISNDQFFVKNSWIIFLDSTELKIVWIKITTFFERHVSIIRRSFSS